jgi:hypothetical protein
MIQPRLSSFFAPAQRQSLLVEELVADAELQRKRLLDSRLVKVKKPKKENPWQSWTPEKKAEMGQKLLDSNYACLKVFFACLNTFIHFLSLLSWSLEANCLLKAHSEVGLVQSNQKWSSKVLEDLVIYGLMKKRLCSTQ